MLPQIVTLAQIDHDVQLFQFAVDRVSLRLPEKEASLNQNFKRTIEQLICSEFLKTPFPHSYLLKQQEL
jgi:hypothetical protein